jgi:hypothetical protein
MMRSTVFTMCLLSLSGCILQTRVVHDGLETVVLDAETKMPLPAAFAYDGFDSKKTPHVLARSNAYGKLLLEPETHLVITAPLGEAFISQWLWICKEGYKPIQVGNRSGWNADYQPGKYYRPANVELTKSALPPTESCLDIER